MEIKVLSKKTNELKLEIPDLTLCELLRNELWNDKTIIVASYAREHPDENPILTIATEGKPAKKALQDAIKRAEKKNDGILKEFKGMK